MHQLKLSPRRLNFDKSEYRNADKNMALGRLAAWIDLVASVVIRIGATRALLANSFGASLLLPVGIELVNLSVVIPIVRSGRPRHYLVSITQATLVK